MIWCQFHNTLAQTTSHFIQNEDKKQHGLEQTCFNTIIS